MKILLLRWLQENAEICGKSRCDYLILGASLLIFHILRRLDKITKIESQLTSGKSLQEEQIQLLKSKASIEKVFIELDSVKIVLEEIVKEVFLNL